PGEPVISADRGWPRCGCLFDQRLLIGGFKALPNAWAFSRQADYFEFSDRFTDATGPGLVPMDTETGNEAIPHMAANTYLNIFTSKAEYWLADRAIDRTKAPNHVQSSVNGSQAGVPVVQNEGASIYVHADGAVLSRFAFGTDNQGNGNFSSQDMTLFASHLFS